MRNLERVEKKAGGKKYAPPSSKIKWVAKKYTPTKKKAKDANKRKSRIKSK